MPPTQSEILHAIEGSMVTRVEAPDISWFDVEGIVGRYHPNLSHPLMNLVGKTNLAPEKADAIIEQIVAPFKERGHMLGWIDSPSAKPDDLGDRLKRAGFVTVADTAGLYLSDLNHPVKPNPDVTVRRATAADDEDVRRLYTEAYPMPADMTATMLPYMDALGIKNYLAFVPEEERPVAIASMFYVADSTIVALQGAATLEAYRGRGIYTSLMAQRLKDTHADGMEVAIMQAGAASAPICKKLGFTAMCDVTIYAWLPPA